MINRLMASRWALACGALIASAAAIVFFAVAAYTAALVVGLVVGFVAAVAFLAMHRPHQWLRLEALNVTVFPLAVAALYGRSLGVLILSWPPRTPQSVGQAIFSLAMLALVDAGLVARLVSYRRFLRADRALEADRANQLAGQLRQIARLERVNRAQAEMLAELRQRAALSDSPGTGPS